VNADDLAQAVRRLVDRVNHWTPPRWAASSASGGGSRADVIHGLVQRLADRAADAEGEPRRPVPRLEHDASLPDQLRVVAADLLAAGAPDEVLRAALEDVAATGRAL